jgi:hypothetical protein
MNSDAASRAERVDKGWADVEFRDVDLGDGRLERRLRLIANSLGQQPSFPINQASIDQAATKAAYRFFSNEKVTPDRILSPHRRSTVSRLAGEDVVLVAQDTTYLNFTSHRKTKGLGPIGDASSGAMGLIVHSALAVTPDGLPLGLLAQKTWARSGHRVPR